MSCRNVALCLAAVMAVLSCPASGRADEGYWRLVKTETRGQAQKYKTPSDHKQQVESSPGLMRVTLASYRNESHKEKITEVIVACTWGQPPARSKPDEPWKGGFRAVLERKWVAPGWTVGFGSLKGDVESGYTVYDANTPPKKPGDGHLFTAARTFICVPEFEETEEGTFVFPAARPGQDRLLVEVRAEALGVSECYGYTYEWVVPQEEPLDAGLRLRVTHSLGGIVQGATFRVRDERRGERFEMTSSAAGLAETMRKVAPADFPLKWVLEQVVLGPATSYHVILERPVPASIYTTGPIVLPLGRRVEITREQRLTTTIDYVLPLVELKVSASAWNAGASQWQPCRARLLVSTDAGRKVLQADPAIFDRTGIPGLAKLFVPARELLGAARAKVLGMDPATKNNDLRSFELPMASASKGVYVALLLCGLEQKLERISGELFRFFSPLVGEQRAMRIARVGLVMDPGRAVPAYLDGNILLPAGLDLTRDECAETLMHEWSHHAMAVLADDPGVEGQLGGPHQTWEAAPNRELAWDEARAHFLSVVLTRRLELPRVPGSFEDAASRQVRQTVPAAGETVEGVGASALLAYYTAAGHRRTEDVMRDFLGTQDANVAGAGNPPRTSREFFARERLRVEQQRQSGVLGDADAARRLQALTRVTTEYRINP